MIFATAALTLLAAGAANADDADVAAGQAAFRKCAVCHTLEEGKNRVGPSLFGVVGRTPGTLEGYRYSSAMVEFGKSGAVWDDATLSAYLEGPRKLVAKTKMAFPGVKSEEERAALIDLLKSVTPSQ